MADNTWLEIDHGQLNDNVEAVRPFLLGIAREKSICHSTTDKLTQSVKIRHKRKTKVGYSFFNKKS